MKYRFLRAYFVAILVTVLSVASLGQQRTSSTDLSAERLRTHVTYLASEALEGRRTGTAGAQGAAQYIAGEFSRLGLRPGLQSTRAARSRSEAQARYLQHFPYVAGVELGRGNHLAFSTGGSATTLRIGEEWMPLGFSTNARIESSPVVLAGFGITASELNYNDYSGLDSNGRVALVLPGTPDGDNPHGQFARYDELRWKAIAARNAGATALVVVAKEKNFVDDRLARLRYNHAAGDSGLPVVIISRQFAVRLLGLNDVKGLSELENTVRQSRSQGLDSNTLKSTKLTLVTDVIRKEVSATNVIGILEGSDSVLKNEAVVIGAHYDHLGRGGDGSLAPQSEEIHFGADDNASGVAGMLELARVFSSQRPRFRRTLVFIAFSGEEEGLLGSSYYVNNPVVPLANTVAMINMDMIGRMRNRSLVIGGVGTATEWRASITAANLMLGVTVTASGSAPVAGSSVHNVPLVVASDGRTVVSSDASKQLRLTLNEDGYGPSDHSSFYAKQIPVLFFWTGTHEDYHKPSDTADKINYEDQVTILDLALRILRSVDHNDKRPTYTVAKSAATARATGFNVYLGTIPSYADASDGLLLDAVREDSPAAKAGLRAGDRIVKLGGREIHNVYDYTYALGELKAGQEYEVEIIRGGERLNLKITPAPRR